MKFLFYWLGKWRVNWYGDNGYSTLKYLFVLETPFFIFCIEKFRRDRI